MKNLAIVAFLICSLGTLQAQKNDLTPLFSEEKPLDIKLRFSVKDVKAIKVDTVYTASVLHFKNGDTWDSIKVDIRARGNFRRANCYFPPLRVKIKKDDAKGTVFEGNKSLKLVLPCKSAKEGNLIYREYVCYQMYEPITKYTFNTRLVNISFTDLSNKKMANIAVPGFFIEDDDVVAKRHNGEVVERKINPLMLADSMSVRHDIFQYMIGNTDWSTAFGHNAKLIQLNSTKKLIPLTYDFDMAGFVDAPYAEVNETLGIASVKERLFRGFCRPDPLMQAIRQEYIANEKAIMGAIEANQSLFDPKEYAGMTKFMTDFFTTMRDNTKFKTSITDACRTK
ncbi:MAG: hypothetical protein ACO263_09015 [Cyclobacteriaceae bacterium]|jgi:hypothetical protein